MSDVLAQAILNDEEIFDLFNTLLDKNYVEYAYADLFANVIGVSQKKLNAITRKNTGKTACQLVEEKIVNKTIDLLKGSDLAVKEIAIKLGYEDQYYFYRMFKRQTGLPPRKYRMTFHTPEK